MGKLLPFRTVDGKQRQCDCGRSFPSAESIRFDRDMTKNEFRFVALAYSYRCECGETNEVTCTKIV
jgi:hypothetical protein